MRRDPLRPLRSIATLDIVGDRHALLAVGMGAVLAACVVFGAARLATTLVTGARTPWWANLAGAAATAAIYLWYRRRPDVRSSVAAHSTALVATVALVIPVAYGMSSTIRWLGLVGFAMVLLGRGREAWAWGLAIPLVTTAAVLVEPFVQLPGAPGETSLERGLARIAFVVVLIGMAAAFRGIAERRARELHDSEARHREVFDHAPVAIAHLDRRLRVTDCNERFAGILGTHRDGLVGADLRAMEECRILPALEIALGGGHGEYDGPLERGPSREEIAVSVRTAPLLGDDATVTGAIAIVEDVTDRRRMEQELRRSHADLEQRVRERTEELRQLNLKLSESEERLRLLFETSLDGILSTAPDGRIFSANPAACRLLGQTEDELRKGGRDSVIDVSDPRLAPALEERSRTGRFFGELTMLRKDGARIPCEISSAVYLDRERNLRSSMVIRDVTERRAAETALRESETRFRRLIEEAPIASVISRAGTVLFANSKALEVFGLAGPGAAVGKPAADLYAPECRAESAERTRRRGLGLPVPAEFESVGQRADGGRFPMHVAVAQVELPDGAVSVSFIRDVTEAKRSQRLLARQARFDDVIAGLMARFISATAGEVDAQVTESLGEIGRFLEAEHAYVVIFQPDRAAWGLTHQWRSGDAVDLLQRYEKVPTGGAFAWAEATLLRGEAVQVRSLEELPPDAEAYRAALQRDSVRSVLLVPLGGRGEALRGGVGLRSYSRRMDWEEQDIRQLGLWSDAIATALDRKRADQALRESEERLSLALEATGLGLWDWRLDTGQLTLSERWAAMMGYSLADLEAEKEPWRTRVHPHDLPAAIDALERHLKGDTAVYESEHRLRTKSGAWIWVADRGRVVERDSRGAPVRITGTQRDITERMASEEAQRRLAAAVEQTDEAVLITDPAGTIEYVNPAFERITGYRRDEALGRSPRILKSGRHDAAFYRAIWDAVTSGEVWSGRLTNRRKDGSTYEEEMTISPLRDPSGRIVNFVAVKRDVTREEALREQLNQAQKMEAIGRLAGGIAHDFNNLLQAMLTHAQLLRAHAGDVERVRSEIGDFELQINRGGALTRQLLLFSRRDTVRRERLDLNDVARAVAGMLRRLVRENVAFALEAADRPAMVDADRGQLEQVLMNLVVNASDAMQEGGRLVIRAGSDGSAWCWLEVEDTGHGIPEPVREHIFEPFFTTKGAGKGTGLGLSVVHGIVTQHGGRVDLQTREGQGSRFRVILPRAGSGDLAPAAQPAAASTDLPPGAGERILVVEDEAGAREGIREILATLGYDVVAVGSGAEAGRLDPSLRFALLLSDLMLPDVSGNELAGVLQARWPGMAVILMSGYAEDEALRRGIEAGHVRFLQKPFDMQTLAGAVRAALGA